MPKVQIVELETPNILPIGELRSILKKRNEFRVICQICEEHVASDIHHLDGHHHNNEAANLAAVCKRCHNEIHHISPKMTDLTLAARQLDDIKRQRIAMSNRLGAYKDLDYETPMADRIFNHLLDLEKEATSTMVDMLQEEQIYTQYLERIKGIGPLVSGILVSEIGSVHRFEYISALWSYCGFAVNDGQVQKRTAGQTANWNHKIRATCIGIMVPNFIRLKGHDDCYGRQLYDQYKAFYTERDGDKLTKGHVDNRARRKVAKIFLSCLWMAWRQLEGLPVSDPYPVKLGHAHIIKPSDWIGESWP